MGYFLQSNNKHKLLTLQFGVPGEESMSFSKRLKTYRQFVYEIGIQPTDKGQSIDPNHFEHVQKKGFQITRMDRFRFRTRYFTDSGVIGSQSFVQYHYNCFQDYFDTKKPKIPVTIKGLKGLFSLKRLSEAVIT